MFERDIELGIVRELKRENFLGFLRRRHVCLHRSRFFRKFDQPEKSSDAMLKVNDVIAFGQFAKIDLRAIALGPAQAPTGMRGKSAEQFRGGKNNEICRWKTKAARQCAFDKIDVLQ